MMTARRHFLRERLAEDERDTLTTVQPRKYLAVAAVSRMGAADGDHAAEVVDVVRTGFGDNEARLRSRGDRWPAHERVIVIPS